MRVTFATDDVKIYLANAGGGKTSALMAELDELLEIYRPDEIAFTSFTRKGVQVGIDRILKKHQELVKADLPYFQTLHKMCFRESGLKQENIFNAAEMRKFNALCGFNLNITGNFNYATDDAKLLQRYDAKRSGVKDGILIEPKYDEGRYNELVKCYEQYKEDNNLVDFYDCLIRYLEAGKSLPVAVYVLDESQDTTPLQWHVVVKASDRAEKIRLAGDIKQCLYSYAGSTPDVLVDLTKRYETVNIDLTYRLPAKICAVADSIDDLMYTKTGQTHKPFKQLPGSVVEYGDREQFLWELMKDFRMKGYRSGAWYLLFRCNYFIADVADVLRSHVIPFHLASGFCIGENVLNRIQTYYNYRLSGFRDSSRAAFAEKYGITDFERPFTDSDLIPGINRHIVESYVDKFGLDILKHMAREEPYCYAGTTYKVKGGEADNVAVFLDATKQVAENMAVDLDSELRVMYVACTRAKENLYIIAPETENNLLSLWEAISENMAE